MIFHEIVCWQTILMKYHTLSFQQLEKMSQNLPSAAVVIGALRVKGIYILVIECQVRASGPYGPLVRIFGFPGMSVE